ncbi:MAG: hypothetical protein QXL67_04830 [Candidatus Bathyarchaeia archaeon]
MSRKTAIAVVCIVLLCLVGLSVWQYLQIVDLKNRVEELEKARIDVWFYDSYSPSLDTDKHHVSGFVINFGNKKVYNVTVTFVWEFGPGSMHIERVDIGTVNERSILGFARTFEFDNTGNFSYSWTWKESP